MSHFKILTRAALVLVLAGAALAVLESQNAPAAVSKETHELPPAVEMFHGSLDVIVMPNPKAPSMSFVKSPKGPAFQIEMPVDLARSTPERSASAADRINTPTAITSVNI